MPFARSSRVQFLVREVKGSPTNLSASTACSPLSFVRRCSHHTRPLLVTVIFICDRGFIVRELTWPTLWVWHCVSLVNYHRRQLRLYNWRAVIMDWKFGLLFACLLVDGEWFCEVLTGVYAFMIHYAIYKGRFLTADVLCHSVPQLDTIIACIWSY